MSLGALSFLTPLPLFGLIALPIIWWLLRTTPPSPSRLSFPPTRLLKDLLQTQNSPAHSPWWLTLLRLIIATLVILALAQPILNRADPLLAGQDKKGPLIVLLDNGWRAANQWPLRKIMLQTLFEEAQSQERLVFLVPTAPNSINSDLDGMSAHEGASLIEQLTPTAFNGDRAKALAKLEESLERTYAQNSDAPINGSLYWLSDGVDQNDEQVLAQTFTQLSQRGIKINIVTPDEKSLPLGLSSRLGQNGVLYGVVEASKANFDRSGQILALSKRNEVLGRSSFELKAGEQNIEAQIDLPLELRNQIASLRIAGNRSAGSVHLLDQRSHWRRVGLISNESGKAAQPLLSALYYINRALDPFAQVVKSDSADVAQTVAKFTERGVSVVMMADVGRLIGAPLLRLTEWVEDGGVLVRFAGPHMEESQDALLPTPLREGGRRLGGALSWSKPQQLANFDDDSPFAGLTIPEDVFVTRQLLADPSRMSDDVYIWARLKDGTPLVTASKEVNGWVVLVHVTANSDWSSLPLSGLFVDMLRRLTQLSVAPVARKSKTEEANGETVTKETDETNTLLAPYQVLNGFGQLQKPTATVEPIAYQNLKTLKINSIHPPGFYGPAEQSVALNLFPQSGPLEVLNMKTMNAALHTYKFKAPFNLRGPLFISALILLLLDSLLVLWLRGALGLSIPRTKPSAPVIALCCLTLGFLAASPAFAQDEKRQAFEMKSALNTHLAYVKTGNEEIDAVSRQGLRGLSYILNTRTAVEPLEPLGVDITRDELAFFPVLYWPVGPYTKPLSEKIALRINAYMKHGGMIIFDTKDQNSRTAGLPGKSQLALEALLSKLDIPRLEQVPKGHVLTKSFYLLSSFPGRYQQGALWVEAPTRTGTTTSKQTSQIDGVSTILITSNDFASAWAVDESLQPIYPVGPNDNLQREMAFRVGVNIIMYALAGNYKADQVHVPALLERLGQ